MGDQIDLVRCFSSDIGTKNLQIYIEEFDRCELLKLENVPKHQRYNIDGTLTPKFKILLEKIYLNGRCLHKETLDIRGNSDQEMFSKCYKYLNERKHLFSICDISVIELQLKANPMAQRVMQHLYSFFIFNYMNTMILILFPATHKTKVLGMPRYNMEILEELRKENKEIKAESKCIKTGKPATKSKGKKKILDLEDSKKIVPSKSSKNTKQLTYNMKTVNTKTMNKKAKKMTPAQRKQMRKEWSIKNAREIATMRGDKELVDEINGKKGDDLADTINQLQAFKMRVYLDRVL